MSSKIDIASNALLLIGDEPINSFDEPGAGATAAANLYPDSYGMALSEHPWSFATKYQKLNRLAAVPDPLINFKFGYQLPTDLIRLWQIAPHSNYEIVDGVLYSNQNELLARYTYKPSETVLPPHFTKSLEFLLASQFSISVTESTTKHELFERKYLKAIAQARTIDSQSHPQTPIVDRPFVDVRNSGFRGF